MPDASEGSPAYDYRTSSLDEDRKRAKEIEARMEQRLRDRGAPKGRKHPAEGAEGTDDEMAAAMSIQKGYRAHVQRREGEGRNLSSSQRWTDGMRQRRLSAAGRDQRDGKNDATSRWRRAEVYTSKISEGKSAAAAQGAEGEMSADEEADRLGRNDREKEKIRQERTAAKLMEGQYWLEMVDKKHRYGSNLKYYHQKWNEEETEENFFHWLDEGAGKDVDLEQCPRSRLEKERITYLTAEQRETYRVVVSKEGKLVWAKDGTDLDTSKYHEDRGPEHGGIVEISEEEYQRKEEKAKERLREKKANGGESPSSSDLGSSSSSSSSSDEADEIREGTKAYGDKGGTAGQGKGVKQFKERVKYYTSPRAIMDHLLRTTINKNTWLYVCDLSGNLYVGIKKTGQFQHSSLLYGARVTSAGLLKASHGKLTSLSPLSGHYRAGTMHFKAFIRSLDEQGVDMSHVAISKSVMTIRGIEKYGRFTKKKKALSTRLKTTFTGAASPSSDEAESAAKDLARIRSSERNEGEDAHEREVKEGEEKMRDKKEDEDRPLPGEGKKVEDMTEEERMERGVALVQRAFERGLTLHDKRDEGGKDEEKEEK
ncbi:hypothetical protein JCM10207_004525 [Rhodosporidiobolus poonsookiae]